MNHRVVPIVSSATARIPRSASGHGPGAPVQTDKERGVGTSRRSRAESAINTTTPSAATELMKMTETTTETDDTSDVLDPYAAICAAMTPGLLVTVNDSGGAHNATVGELEVLLVDDETGLVELRGFNGQFYRLKHDTPDGTVIEEIDDNGYGGRETVVETIEIIGIGDSPSERLT
jgi:hypothetical protein